MKMLLLALSLLIATSAATAQTTTKAATTPKAAATAKANPTTPGATLPPGVPRVRGIVKTAFALRYEDIKIGTGADAEPNKMYKVLYTGYLAADGYKFDSSENHRLPLKDKDGKIVMSDDGKPKLGDAEPISFPQGFGRVIPGFDQGFAGMKIGGKRRLLIPWQLAYGAHGRPGPDPQHPGIPAKADLIFDIELVDVSEMQMPQGHPGMGAVPGAAPRPGMPITPAHPQVTTPPPAAPASPTTATPPPSPGATAPATAPSPSPAQPSTNPQPPPAPQQPQPQQ